MGKGKGQNKNKQKNVFFEGDRLQKQKMERAQNKKQKNRYSVLIYSVLVFFNDGKSGRERGHDLQKMSEGRLEAPWLKSDGKRCWKNKAKKGRAEKRE